MTFSSIGIKGRDWEYVFSFQSPCSEHDPLHLYLSLARYCDYLVKQKSFHPWIAGVGLDVVNPLHPSKQTSRS